MGIHNDKVRLHFVPRDNEPLRKPRKQERPSASLQRPRRLIPDPASKKLVREGERLLILHDLVTVAHNSQNALVKVPDVRLITGNQNAVGRAYILLLHFPVQPGKAQGFL